jgi:hypothetical protein
MRNPPVNAAAAEAKCVRDAVDAARTSLWFMIRRLHIDGEKNPAEDAYCSAVDLVTRILNDADADRLVRKYASAQDARDKILSALRQGRPPLRPKAGRHSNTARDRWIADIVENIRRRGFATTRGDATKAKGTQESACSIVAAASRELESGVRENQQQMRTTLLELGFTPRQADLRIQGLQAEAKALSEDSIKRIWGKSTWAAKARARTRLTSRP